MTLSLYDQLKQSINFGDVCCFVRHFHGKQMEFSGTCDRIAIRQQETAVQ
jgi:hypothetical protein